MEFLTEDFDNIINELSTYKLGLTRLTSEVKKLNTKINKITKQNKTEKNKLSVKTCNWHRRRLFHWRRGESKQDLALLRSAV